MAALSALSRVIGAVAQARATWNAIDIHQVRAVAWSSIDQFQDRLWRDFTGGDTSRTAPTDYVLGLLKQRLGAKAKSARGIAVVCGDMHGERYFFENELLPFARVDGYDLSEVSLQRFTPKKGLKWVPHVTDCNALQLEPESAQLLIGWHGLHHLQNFAQLFSQCNQALTRDGLMLMYEWVGPRYLQIPLANRVVATALLLALFPAKGQRTTHQGKVKGPFFMQLAPSEFDPSEACASEQLWPEFERYFKVISQVPHGGLTYPMFEGIAQNLDQADPANQWRFKLVQDAEELLTKWGVIKPLFVLAIGEPRKLDPV